ncbi:hypothetical protein J4209_04400 [Candidatus Woesearchaeota archaeon]|nr:hypothetical protein [Candidatus Woesearchaeota archaeon]
MRGVGMWNKCESCGKQIGSAEDCRLSTNDGVIIHTYCRNCYEKKKESR